METEKAMQSGTAAPEETRSRPQPPTVEVLHAIAVTTRGPEGLEDEVTEAVGSSFGESTPWAGETTVVEGFGEGGLAE